MIYNKDYTKFNTILNNRRVLYIPIISCINRQTSEYNLACDGNVNRFITTFSKCNSFKHLDIVLPSVHVKGSEYIVENFKTDKITITYSDYFGIHAGEQRNNDTIVQNMYNSIDFSKYDCVIFESQKLGKMIIENNPEIMTIFYNPVSKTNKTRIFLNGYEDINQYLIENSTYTIVCSPDQVEFYEAFNDKLLYLDILIDRDLPYFEYTKDDEILDLIKDKKVFYLPFRLTDEGYQFDLVIEVLSDELKSGSDFIVLYSDPNNSQVLNSISIDEKLKSKFIKVSTNRDTFYTLIDAENVIVIYYEDLRFINHSAIHEMLHNNSKCMIRVKSNDAYNMDKCERVIVDKPTLIILEGQDQTGKDTILDMLDDVYVYKQKTSEQQGVNYKDKVEYEKWIKQYISDTLNELKDLSKHHNKIAMTRLVMSDNVFSDCFGRSHIVEDNFYDDIHSFFNVKTVCVLWDNYQSYLNRISSCNTYKQYEEDMFNKIKERYLYYANKEPQCVVMEINDKQSKQEVYDTFKSLLNTIQ